MTSFGPTSTSEKKWWSVAFNKAARGVESRNYDLKSLTKAKVENVMTTIFVSHLLSVLPDANIYTEVPYRKIIGKTSPLQYGERADLMMLERDNQVWNQPKLYAEFKLVYNDDLKETKKNPQGVIRNPAQFVELSNDRERLSAFKKFSKDTVCLQVIYFCFNPKSEYKNSERNSSVKLFLDSYCNKSEHSEVFKRKSASTKKPIREQKSEVISNEVISIVDEDDFWLNLVLLEIEPTKQVSKGRRIE